MSVIRKVFNYLKPLWTGEDGKISVNRCIAIWLTYKLTQNVDYVIYKWEQGRPLGDISTIILTIAGLIPVLLGITAWSNATAKRIDASTSLPPDTMIKVEKAETVTTGVSTNGKTDKRQTDTTTTTTNTEPIYTPPPGDA